MDRSQKGEKFYLPKRFCLKGKKREEKIDSAVDRDLPRETLLLRGIPPPRPFLSYQAQTDTKNCGFRQLKA